MFAQLAMGIYSIIIHFACILHIFILCFQFAVYFAVDSIHYYHERKITARAHIHVRVLLFMFYFISFLFVAMLINIKLINAIRMKENRYAQVTFMMCIESKKKKKHFFFVLRRPRTKDVKLMTFS